MDGWWVKFIDKNNRIDEHGIEFIGKLSTGKFSKGKVGFLQTVSKGSWTISSKETTMIASQSNFLDEITKTGEIAYGHWEPGDLYAPFTVLGQFDTIAAPYLRTNDSPGLDLAKTIDNGKEKTWKPTILVYQQPVAKRLISAHINIDFSMWMMYIPSRGDSGENIPVPLKVLDWVYLADVVDNPITPGSIPKGKEPTNDTAKDPIDPEHLDKMRLPSWTKSGADHIPYK